MSKYLRITADYRPNNPNKPTYDFCVKDDTTKKQLKDWFQQTYSWLKVYNVEEIAKENAHPIYIGKTNKCI